MATGSQFDVGALTDVGRRRKDNQDSVLCAEDWGGDAYARLHDTYGHLYLVADGVGGNDHGDVASRMVVDHVMAYFYSDDAYSNDPVARLNGAIQRATRDIYDEARRMRNNMASTLVAALVHDDTVTIANVGDSPAFLCRSGETPRKLTVDHIRRESDGSQYLSQSMGDASVSVAFRTVDFAAGDTVVLCSDGLSDLVKPEQIKRVVSTNPARRAVRELVGLANRYGGHDNISALVVRHGKLPLLYRKQVRQVVGAGLVISLLLVMLTLGVHGLLSGSTVMADGSVQGASFNGNSISVPMLNPTTGLVEMVQATLTPTSLPTELPVAATTAPTIALPVVKAPDPTQVVRAISSPTPTRVVSPGKTVVAPQIAAPPVQTSPTAVPRIPPTANATVRPTEARPTHTTQPTATTRPTDASPATALPTSTPRPTAVPTATARPTDEPDNRAPRPTAAPTATTRPTDAPTTVPRSTEVPTNLPETKPQPKPDPKPDPKPEPTAVPTVAPTATPKPEPTAVPTVAPTATPKPDPTSVPTTEPTSEPKPDPTKEPKAEPTAAPGDAAATATP